MKKTIEIPVQVRLAALGSIDIEKRTAELVFSTGAAVKRMDWWTGETYFEELSLEAGAVRMDRLNGGAPLLDTHDSWELDGVLGVVEKAWLSAGEGRALVRFARVPEVESTWLKVQDGIIRNVSVGYMVHKFQDVTPSDEKIKRLMAVDWEPFEISLVPIGADAKAGVRSRETKSRCEIEISERSEDSTSVPPPEVANQDPAGQAAPPAKRGGVIESLRRHLDLMALEQ